MKIEHLGLTNFRNYENKEIDFSSLVTLFYGNNGTGKTNILEALYLSSVGRSPRTTHDQYMIRRGTDSASVRVGFRRRETSQQIRIELHANSMKKVELNSTPIRQKELVHTLQTVFFGPDDLELIKGAPQKRRRFIDLCLSRANPTYYDSLLQYNRIIRHRNTLLKENRVNEIDPWDEQLANLSVYLTEERLQAFEVWNHRLHKMMEELTQEKLKVKLEYIRPYARENENSEDYYLQLLKKYRERDSLYGYTSVGPHRADFVFYHDDVDLSKYGSQGEQRLAVLAVKMSEIDFLQEHIGEMPVLLLDDVLSELDPQRQEALLAWTKNHEIQLIMTASYLPESIKVKEADIRAMEKI